jgi:hypothetical protein
LVQVVLKYDVELSVLNFIGILIFVDLNTDLAFLLIGLHCHHHAEWLVIFLRISDIIDSLYEKRNVFAACFLNYDGHFITLAHKVT